MFQQPPSPSSYSLWIAIRRLVLVLEITAASLATVVQLWGGFCTQPNSRAPATKAILATVDNAIRQYYMETSSLPVSLSRLVDAKILETRNAVDGWRRPLRYRIDPGSRIGFVLRSDGADGVPSTPDDLDIAFLRPNAGPPTDRDPLCDEPRQ